MVESLAAVGMAIVVGALLLAMVGAAVLGVAAVLGAAITWLSS